MNKETKNERGKAQTTHTLCMISYVLWCKFPHKPDPLCFGVYVYDFLRTLMQVSTQIWSPVFGTPPLRAVGEKEPSQGTAVSSLSIPLHGAGLTCKVKTRRLYCKVFFFLFYDWEIKLRALRNIIISVRDRFGDARHKRIIIGYEPKRTTGNWGKVKENWFRWFNQMISDIKHKGT